MRILLLIDNGRSVQPFIQEIRNGIVAFADAERSSSKSRRR